MGLALAPLPGAILFLVLVMRGAGEALAPNRPGLGIELDWKGLETVRAE